ncbi:hypothetical protein AC1031_019732 [Aphanomyces cochlioides]|nr:hypothetical protein AC1031_019732 [Aphanomyces cochlioides]
MRAQTYRLSRRQWWAALPIRPSCVCKLSAAQSRQWSSNCGQELNAVEKGFAYETQVASVLEQYKCKLTPTSKSADGGIDHHGEWNLPDMKVPLVTQCKHEAKPTGVAYLREFEGVLSSQVHSVVGVFASASGYSVYAKRFFSQMKNPAIRVTIVDGVIIEFDMNPPARRRLPKLVPGTMFVDNKAMLVLTYDGHELNGDS